MLEIQEKEAGKIKRLTNKTFKFDKRFGTGFYTANYFLKTRKIVEENLAGNIVMEQFFQRADNVMLCGIDEAIALVYTFARNPQDLKIQALNDGDMISNGEPVLKITGRYEDFGFLESAIDGILARRTSVCTNCHNLMKVVNGKKVLNMGDRQDDPYTQMGDGYAAYVAGMRLFSTDAYGEYVGLKGKGTMPHALIQLCDGDIARASECYLKTYPDEKVTALIDYHNNVVEDSVKLAKVLQRKLGAVRADTSKSLVDHYFDGKDTSGFDPHGVCAELIFALRKALDDNGFNYVKIIVSSGFDVEKVKDFEKRGVPVDTYGVGTSLLRVNLGFTGDLVRLNGKDQAKEGRKEIPSSRMEEVKYTPEQSQINY
ncbi:MAG: nicotinate phosphoribosyltransferase [Bacilli bacterium]|nr:nicotinate phosphoribosyltransferase [Bacilli bacterium]